MTEIFNNTYENKTVLVTGATGFKGSWLCTWLLKLGANVVGIADGIPSSPSMFEALYLKDKINFQFCDINDLPRLTKLINDTQPDFIFHLAAQSIVSESYSNPTQTIITNVLGTTNILEALRTYQKPATTIIVTSDKCYENVEWEWGYRETDQLGGQDIYSASKAAAEIITSAYQVSFFNSNPKSHFATVRAGNVIGGGDWSKDRIVVDCVRKWSSGDKVEVRSPNSTRPWQHVLEPLSGYLMLAWRLSESNNLHGEAFNFGPKVERNVTVGQLIQDLQHRWPGSDSAVKIHAQEANKFHEAGLLKLNCDKALFHLGWEATLNYDRCLNLVVEWYDQFYHGIKPDMFQLTMDQIQYYQSVALLQENTWIS